ncbi:RNA polymerase sigma factor [Fulvivirga sp. 29W222]|uniref:RNA polymerase sigma factor n=1 Tax=Fulvivirga marina TaxID=2494733 RepID=A0A937G0E8_9BACT|nr:RNA polymerase sigma factor [Fulvivirga marina]MBL6447690.1 RNA polymerase sigma factor [Fulvivirga marina]
MGENVCEEGVFNKLFNKLSRELYQFLYYKYGADNNPHDMVQDAFIKLWNNCKKVSPEKAKSFLYTVASNQVLNELSKKKTVLKYRQENELKSYTPESPEYIMEGNEYMDKLQQALESLTEAQRVAFLLNRVEGKKHQEIADMLGISRKAVEKRIYTALAILREKVEGI